MFIFFGRGNETHQYIGNARFRQLVVQTKGMYVAIPSREEKDRVARAVKAIVESRNGRFLKRVENSQGKGITTWLPVDESVALLKIKSAFQYVLYQKEGRDGDGGNGQSEELSDTSSKCAASNVQLEPNLMPIGLSVTSFGDERRIQELMATMKQQLAPCQNQLGGTDKIQALVEKSIRNLQGAVSQAFSRDSGQPQLREMSCMKELSMAIAKGSASAKSEAKIDQSLSGLLVDRKPAAQESGRKVSVPKSDASIEFPVASSGAQSYPARGNNLESSLRARNQLQAAAADPASEGELRQQLMLQVSRLSTDELLNLATLARGAAMAPSLLTGNRSPDQRTATIHPSLLQRNDMLISDASPSLGRNNADGVLGYLRESGAALETRERKRRVDDWTDGSHMYTDNEKKAKREKVLRK